MRYFEKQASVKKLLKAVKAGAIDVEGAIAKRTQLELRKNRILNLKRTKPDLFYSPKMIQRKTDIHNEIMKHQSIIKKMASTTSPFQGTMLNVRTREAQRKYKSKILGKKRANILIPLWSDNII